ncbi:hypothetical protein VVR12_03195 [Rothia sp. LK2588]|uniref:hypothetical protein n=1 Tax=Rothia sp. LK2588 TaxID=3114369 RepID=UPI0034CF40C0
MNPAAELQRIFQEWTRRGGSAYSQISMNNDGPRLEAIRAVKLTIELSELVNILESKSGLDFSFYHEPIANWQRAIFHYGKDWGNTQFSAKNTDMLRALSTQLDAYIPGFRTNFEALESRKPDLLSQLDALLQYFEEEREDLDNDFVSHATWLIEHIKNALESDDELNIADFNESVRLLKIYVQAAAESSNSDSGKEKFRQFLRDFFHHPVTNTVIGELVGYGLGQLPPGQ